MDYFHNPFEGREAHPSHSIGDQDMHRIL